jgi:hypothetical protein
VPTAATITGLPVASSASTSSIWLAPGVHALKVETRTRLLPAGGRDRCGDLFLGRAEAGVEDLRGQAMGGEVLAERRIGDEAEPPLEGQHPDHRRLQVPPPVGAAPDAAASTARRGEEVGGRLVGAFEFFGLGALQELVVAGPHRFQRHLRRREAADRGVERVGRQPRRGNRDSRAAGL